MKNKQVQRLIKNILFLFLIKGSNYIIPLLTFPYLVRVLGLDKFGLITFSRAFIQYFIIITDYGFNFTATRQIAINSEDDTKLSKIFSSVLYIKIFFLIISFLIMNLVVFTIPKFTEVWLLYYLTFLSVVGNLLFPIWFFQGMEKMEYITYLNVIAKIFTFFAIFILVHQQEDYLLAAFIQSSGTLISGLVSIWVIWKNFSLRLVHVKWNDLVIQLKESGKVFIGSLLGNIMSQGGVLITGFFIGNDGAGLFAIAQKVSATVVSLVQPIEQAIYPYLCNLFIHDKRAYLTTKTKVIGFSFIFGIFSCILVFNFSELITKIISGNTNSQLTFLIKIFAFTLLFTIVNVISNSFILSMNKLKEMSLTYVFSSIIFLATSIPTTISYGTIGMASSFLIVEIFITVRSICIINGKKLILIK